MIRFQCEHCAVELTIREDRAGTLGRCPRCKQAITIPRASQAGPPADDKELTLIAPPEIKDHTQFDWPDERELTQTEQERIRSEQQLLTELGIQPRAEHTGQRRFIWPLDILLYPMSGPGLTVLGIIVGFTLLVMLFERFMPILPLFGIFLFVGRFILGLYAAWYLAECVYDSATGGTRAPDFAVASLGDMWSRVSYLLVVSIVYLLPVVLYRIIISGFEITGARFEIIFWVLAGYALLFFPMGLLAMVVNDSISSVNPFFLLGSIFRAFFQYAGLLLFFAALAVLLWLSGPSEEQSAQLRPFWLETVGLATAGYAAFVLAHILGRFYWRNRERLDWGL